MATTVEELEKHISETNYLKKQCNQRHFSKIDISIFCKSIQDRRKSLEKSSISFPTLKMYAAELLEIRTCDGKASITSIKQISEGLTPSLDQPWRFFIDHVWKTSEESSSNPEDFRVFIKTERAKNKNRSPRESKSSPDDFQRVSIKSGWFSKSLNQVFRILAEFSSNRKDILDVLIKSGGFSQNFDKVGRIFQNCRLSLEDFQIILIWKSSLGFRWSLGGSRSSVKDFHNLEQEGRTFREYLSCLEKSSTSPEDFSTVSIKSSGIWKSLH